MAIFNRGSRFSGGRYGESQGEEVVFPKFINYSTLEPISYVEITAGMVHRPDLISIEAYGRNDLGYHIMAFNLIDHPKDLTAGLTLKIPPVRGVLF
jgi:hypothetical protein